VAYPRVPGGVPTLFAYAHPVPLPAGHGCLVVAVNRGPYLVPAPATCRLKIDGVQVPLPGEGTWHIPVPAGPHDVRFTDWFGIPVMTTQPVVQPAAAAYLSFRFGGWRNRVYDPHGTDVTKFGMWSNYTFLLLTFAVIGLLCCGGFGLAALLQR
jgi:hypothetical protein